MIFKNVNHAQFLGKLAEAFSAKNLGITVRFNSMGVTKGVVKCSQTRMKVFIDIGETRIKMTSMQRVANTPFNITDTYSEVENFILHADDEALIDKATQFIYDTVTVKSEYLTHIEAGNPEKITAVSDLNKLDHTNVFASIVRGLKFAAGEVIVQLDNQTFKLSQKAVEKIPTSGNVVGRYFVMNSRKESTFMPLPLFQSFIKE